MMRRRWRRDQSTIMMMMMMIVSFPFVESTASYTTNLMEGVRVLQLR